MEFQTLDEVEKLHVQSVLEASGWYKPLAARRLGICLKTLYNKINRWAAEAKENGQPPAVNNAGG